MSRILIKISGKYIEDAESKGDFSVFEWIASSLVGLSRNQEIAVVIGGGKMPKRYSTLGAVPRDYIGMMGTIMNAIALRERIPNAVIFSAVEIPQVCRRDAVGEASSIMSAGSIPIFAGGLGYPCFSTDTLAVIKAVELKCETVVKATRVNGVYDKNPDLHSDAKFLPSLSYTDAMSKGIIDKTAVIIAEQHGVKVICCMLSPENIRFCPNFPVASIIKGIA